MSVIAQWLETEPAPIYLLVNPLEDNTILQDFFLDKQQGAMALFEGTSFSEHALKGPWLLPVSGSKVFNQTVLARNAGIWLSTSPDVDMHEVVPHLQSLLLAAMEGELVLFRYYDRRVLSPMLQSLTVTELTQFLGPITQIYFSIESTIASFSRPKRENTAVFKHKQAPWWKIKPTHLTSQIHLERHRFIIERQLWQQCHELMQLQPQRQAIITTAIEQGKKQHIDELDLPLYAAAHLARNIHYSPAAIAQAMKLNRQERQQLIQWMEENHG